MLKGRQPRVRKAVRDSKGKTMNELLQTPIGKSGRAKWLLEKTQFKDEIIKFVMADIENVADSNANRYHQMTLAVVGAEPICDNCFKYFPSRQSLYAHKVRCHNAEKRMNEVNFVYPIHPETQLYYCFIGGKNDQCKLSNLTMRQLIHHLLVDHGSNELNYWGLTHNEVKGYTSRRNRFHLESRQHKRQRKPINVDSDSEIDRNCEVVPPTDENAMINALFQNPANSDLRQNLELDNCKIDVGVQTLILEEPDNMVQQDGPNFRKREFKQQSKQDEIKAGLNVAFGGTGQATVSIQDEPRIHMGKHIVSPFCRKDLPEAMQNIQKRFGIKADQAYIRRMVGQHLYYFYRMSTFESRDKTQDLLETYLRTERAIKNNYTKPLAPLAVDLYHGEGFVVLDFTIPQGVLPLRSREHGQAREEIICCLYERLGDMHKVGISNGRVELDNIYYNPHTQTITLLEWGACVIAKSITNTATRKSQTEIDASKGFKMRWTCGTKDTVDLLWTLADAHFLRYVLKEAYNECQLLPSKRRTEPLWPNTWRFGCTFELGYWGEGKYSKQYCERINLSDALVMMIQHDATLEIWLINYAKACAFLKRPRSNKIHSYGSSDEIPKNTQSQQIEEEYERYRDQWVYGNAAKTMI